MLPLLTLIPSPPVDPPMALALPLYHQRTLTPPTTTSLPFKAQSRSVPSGTLSTNSSKPTFLPRKDLLSPSSSKHVTNFQQLLFFREGFHKQEFWDEIAILERLHYKNKSQHRQAGYFKRLVECRRLASRIKELDIAGLTDELVKQFYSGKSLSTLKNTKSQWDSIPYRSNVAFTMTRILGSIMLLRKMQTTLHETYGAFYQLMSKTQFMPLALISIALCSRLSIISKAWANELGECYTLLFSWIKSFPAEALVAGTVDYEKDLPENLGVFYSEDLPAVPAEALALESALLAETRSSTAMSGGTDLGEVIARVAPPLPSDHHHPSEPSRKPRKESTPQPNTSTNIFDRVDENDNDGDDIIDKNKHRNLLGELDTIFGSGVPKANSTSTGMNPAKRKKTPVASVSSSPSSRTTAEFDLDDIFKDKKYPKIKDNSSSQGEGDPVQAIKKKKLKKSVLSTVAGSASTSPSRSRSQSPSLVDSKKAMDTSRKQSKQGSPAATSNFDQIFMSALASEDKVPSTSPSPLHSSGTLTPKKKALLSKQKDKQDLEDIFGAIKKTKKKKDGTGNDAVGSSTAVKKSVSEMDDIFGATLAVKKKKKKAF